MANVTLAYGTMRIIGQKQSVLKWVYLLDKYGALTRYETNIQLDDIQPEDINKVHDDDFSIYSKFLNLETLTIDEIIEKCSKLHEECQIVLRENLIRMEKDLKELTYVELLFNGEGRWSYQNTYEDLVQDIKWNINYLQTSKNSTQREKQLAKSDMDIFNELIVSDELAYELNQNDNKSNEYTKNEILIVTDYVDYDWQATLLYEENVITRLKTNRKLASKIKDIPFTRQNIIRYNFEREDDCFDDTDESINYLFDAYFNENYKDNCILYFINDLPNKKDIIKKLKGLSKGHFSDVLCWDSAVNVIINIFIDNINEFDNISDEIKRQLSELKINNLED